MKSRTKYARIFQAFLVLAVLAVLVGCKNSLVGLGGRVDLNPPEGDVTSISNGDYVSGEITLEGTIEDDKEIDAVWALINGEIVSGVVNDDGTWEIEVDTDDGIYGGDGDKDIIIYLRDASGKITEKQMLLYFDNTEPVLMVTSPELGSPQDTLTFSIRGEAYDPLRLESITATVSGPAGPTITENLGTNDSWFFNVTHSLSGTYNITITAEDKAGNTSSHVYHSTDLRSANGGDPITVIDLYSLSVFKTGDDEVSHLTITPDDLAEEDLGYDLPSGSRRLSLLYDGVNPGIAVNVDMNLDIPEITVNNPNPNADPPDTLGPSAKINGTVSDNVSVDPDTIEIRFLDEVGGTLTGADAALSTWNPITSYQYINDKNYNFSHDIPAFASDTEYTLEIRAEDENSPTANQGTTDTISFVYDSNAPVVGITFPDLGSYVPNSTTLIQGIVNDTEPIVVQISINGGGYEVVGTFPGSGSDESWSYLLSDYEAIYGVIGNYETVNVTVQATAGASTTRTNHSFVMDRLSPVVSFLTPEDGTDVNGVVTLRVSVSDSSLDTVFYEIGNPGDGLVYGVDEDDIYSFSHSIVTTEFEYEPIATEAPAGSGIWELPVTVTAEDKAGHVTVSSGYSMFIDNARDRPVVSIIYPAEGESYGGEVTVSGIATDDDGVVGAVYAQVDLDTLTGETPDFAGFHTLTDGIVFDGTTTVHNVDENVGYELFGLSSWSFSLNSTGELYDMGGGHNGDIYVKVWAEDPNNASVLSEEQILHFRLDDTLPRIENVRIDGVEASPNDYISGTVRLTADISDNSQINKVEMSYDNGVSWETLPITQGASIASVVNIDTAARVAGGNGILYLRMKATDDTGFNTQEVLPLNVDNDAPTGSYSGDTVLSGTGATLQGTAQDPAGSIAGIERIEVYLERENVDGDGFVYDPAVVYAYTNPPTPNIATEETTFGTGNYYPADDDADPDTPLPGLMTIDDIYEGGSDSPGGDGDGFDESLTLSESTWNWWVNFNSENIPDGDITIHYVVVDKAGNMTHSAQAARIENNPPVIESVVFGTDVNYNGTVNQTVGLGESFRFIDGSGIDDSGEYYVDFDLVTGVPTITARNSLMYIDADESASAGNGDSSLWLWELYYKGGGTNLLGSGTDSATITDFLPSAMPDEDSVSYVLRVTDDAGLSDEVEFLVNLDNDDGIAPEVTLYDLDLTRNFIILARGGAENHGYSVPGFDPDAVPLWGEAQGRLRPAGAGVYDGDDADVSGTVIVSGTVYDTKVIDHVDLTIDGYDGDANGGTFTFLDWDVTANGNLGGLKLASGVTGTAHISSESYGESGGHSVSWSFEFDTADIAGTAAANVGVFVEAYDKSGNDGNDAYTMDVMPFISGLSAGTDGSTDVYRSRFGSWPFQEGYDSPIWISGFNLAPDAGSTEIVGGGGSETLFADPSGSTESLSGLLATGAANTPIAHSGRLSLAVNGIPLMNEYGDFDEDDGDHPYWTDDRYVEIWKVGDAFNGSAYGVYGAMDVDGDDGSFMASWSNWSTASSYIAAQDGARNQIFYRYDPPEYTDIALNESGTPYVAILANFLGGAWGGYNVDSGGVGLWSDRASDAEEYGGNAFEEADAFIQDEMLWQFRNPRIAVTGADADTDIYMTYFDQASSALKFSHFKDLSGSDSIYNLTLYARAIGINDSTNDGNAGTNNPNFIRDLDGNDIALYDLNIVEDGTNSSYYGTWSDVAVDERVGAPVILFSDTDNSSVRLMRATSMNPTDHDAGNLIDMEWDAGNGMIEDTDSNEGYDDDVFDWHPSQTVFSGDSYKNVSIVMDPDGNLHVAAYDVSTGELLYRYAPALTTTDAANAEAYSFTPVEVVDTDGNVGKWAEIGLVNRGATAAVHDYYPVIAYMDSSWIGTYHGLKVARKLAAGWDAGFVPLDTSLEDGRLSAVGSLFENRITASADDYEVGIGFHSTNYEYVRLRPER